MPPSIPSLGLNVFLAISSPCGIEIIISTLSPFGSTLNTSSRIIFLGTGFIAHSPLGTNNPSFVTVPTPFPPFKYILSPFSISS